MSDSPRAPRRKASPRSFLSAITGRGLGAPAPGNDPDAGPAPEEKKGGAKGNDADG